MKLPVLDTKKAKGKRIFVRVDWNVPLHGMTAEDSLKFERTIPDIQALAEHGAVVVVATHLGRPKQREKELSTWRLLPLLTHAHGLKVHFLECDFEDKKSVALAAEMTKKAAPGTVYLLENVRFFKGEEENTPALAKAYAALADIFVNDAFASCHRAHASVVGIAKLLPHFAGPALVDEVEGLEKLLGKPKRPYIAIIGGAKLSTKLEVLEQLFKIADKVMVGGAMANPFLQAKRIQIGKSFIEEGSTKSARKYIKDPKLMLPVDAVVANKVAPGAKVQVADIKKIKAGQAIGDIGPATMRAWAAEIRSAKTIVWNGPVGVAEIRNFSHGSTLIARAVAARSRGAAYGAVGGGDTLPIALGCGMAEYFDHISTGGGAMLEFIAKQGKLPGIEILTKKAGKTSKK